MEKEIWKPAKGYEEIIEVSNLGNVRRKAHSFIKTNGRWCHVPACKLKPSKTKKGYLLVKVKTSKTVSLHRLVATTFIPNPLNLPEINHKDENKENNSVENLEWCTHQYNSSYGTRNLKIKQAQADKPNRGKPISQYTKDGLFVKTYRSIKDATEETGINNICNCVKGKNKYAGGFVWIESTKSFEYWIENIACKIKDKEKTILQIDKNGNIVNEYKSELDIERKTGINSRHISLICRGLRKQSGDFIWKFKN